MGDLRPRDDQPPDDEGVRRPLPDLPPEWGEVIIPDDAAELDAEATQLRRELSRQRRRVRSWARPTNPPRVRDASLTVPFAVISIALVITLISLFVVTWGRAPTQPDPFPVTPSAPVAPASPVPISSGNPSGTGPSRPPTTAATPEPSATAAGR